MEPRKVDIRRGNDQGSDSKNRHDNEQLKYGKSGGPTPRTYASYLPTSNHTIHR
jgi:hypothetical protein